MPEPVNRTVLFDPGVFSESALDIDSLEYLDDIFITHEHPDHLSINLVKKLVEKFPKVRITTTNSVVLKLQEIGIEASALVPAGVTFFNAPHEGHEPFMNPPEEVGIHYLNLMSHPGDSHSFAETKDILALPITAPWGSADRAMQLVRELKPMHVIPIHDWHWKDEVRQQMYEKFEDILEAEGITFYKMQTGEPIVIET